MAKTVNITKVGSATSVVIADGSNTESFLFNTSKNLSVNPDGERINVSDSTNGIITNPVLSFKFSELVDDLEAANAYAYIQAAGVAGLFYPAVNEA